MFKTLSVRVYVCEATAAYNLSPFMCVGVYTYLRMCVDVTRSPEGRDKTIDFTFGLLPCREAGKLTHPLCVCMQVREREGGREGGQSETEREIQIRQERRLANLCVA